jgi:Flp pilus assembly protein TadD
MKQLPFAGFLLILGACMLHAHPNTVHSACEILHLSRHQIVCNNLSDVRFGDLSMISLEFLPSSDTTSHIIAADAAQRAGDFERAIQHFSEAIELGSNNPDVYAGLAKCQFSIEHNREAMEVIEKGLAVAPTNQRLRTMQISYLFRNGRWDEARQSLQDAIDVGAQDPKMYRLLALTCERTGRSNEAVQNYQKALDLDPNYFDALYGIGTHYFNCGAELSNASNRRLEMSSHSSHQSDADAVLRQALVYLERAREVDPDDQKLLQTLRQVYTHLGMMDKFAEVNSRIRE